MQQCHSNTTPPPTQFSLAPVKDPLLQVEETGKKGDVNSLIPGSIKSVVCPTSSTIPHITRLSKQAAHCIPKKDTSFLNDNPSLLPSCLPIQERETEDG
ncbi:hypothetical protein CEXT_629041 [Caerostris extrusa]|uniref:Uncharacterized protein n=1 Tax=Caerostris extrusa TaxID=172846 RepID=A0AAV4P5E1_CAEEX|nr:hypothetical protein CEXT_629041 [Caerostris extrusa]